MSSQNNEAIQGSMTVSRDMTVGGHMTVRGNSVFGHNVTISGWLDAKNIKGPCKGLFASVDALNAVYPKPRPGWYALVGDTLPADVYRAEDGEWVATGEQGGEVNLYLDQLETDVAGLADDVQGILELIGDGLLAGMEFNATADTATLLYTLRNSDGTETTCEVSVPIVTAESAGMMTAADKQALEKAGTDITGLKENLQKETTAREEADTALRESLEKETTARTEADRQHTDDIAELQEAMWPLTVTLSVSPTIVEAGVATGVTLSWSVSRKSEDVAGDSEVTLNGETVTGTSRETTVDESSPTTVAYILKAVYGSITASVTKQVSVVYPSYFGTVASDWVPTEETVKALTKSLQASKSSTHSGISTDNGKIAYCYPASFGSLTSIKDGNGYEVTDSYTVYTVNVDGVAYYCYLLTTPVTSSGVTQIYS